MDPLSTLNATPRPGRHRPVLPHNAGVDPRWRAKRRTGLGRRRRPPCPHGSELRTAAMRPTFPYPPSRLGQARTTPDMAVNRFAGQNHCLSGGSGKCCFRSGKSHVRYAPLRHWLLAASEVPDPKSPIGLWPDVNGQHCQTSSTRAQIFGVGRVVAGDVMSQPLDGPAARRRNLHLHAAGRGTGAQPAGILEGRRCNWARQRRPGQSAPDRSAPHRRHGRGMAGRTLAIVVGRSGCVDGPIVRV
jgi:hypothetical protein